MWSLLVCKIATIRVQKISCETFGSGMTFFFGFRKGGHECFASLRGDKKLCLDEGACTPTALDPQATIKSILSYRLMHFLDWGCDWPRTF